MNVFELKNSLRDVIARYAHHNEYTGEIRRDDMARDCLQVIEDLESRIKELEGIIKEDCYIEINKLEARIKELEDHIPQAGKTLPVPPKEAK